MATNNLDRLITSDQRALMRAPISEARTFPNVAFTDQGMFELEVERVFHKHWMGACFANAIPNVGDVLPMALFGLPIVMVRSVDRRIRVFHNVCPYDGCPVVLEPGNTTELIVAYHGWRYDLEGRLVATPYWDGRPETDGVSLQGHSGDLVEVRSECALGVVFVDLGGRAPSLDEALSPLRELLEPYNLDNLVPVPDSETLLVTGRTVAANWKTYLENAGINVLHEAFTHASYAASPEVPRVADDGTKTYFDHIDGLLMGLGYRTADFQQTYPPLPLPHLGRDANKPPETGYFLTFYPNLVIPVMPSMIRINICLPEAPDFTRLLHCGFVHPEAPALPEFERLRGLMKDGFHEAYREDGIVIEAIQRGRRSPVSGEHFYAPFWDEQHYHLNQLVLNDLESSQAGSLS